MTRTGTDDTSGGHGAVTGALFLCLFAGQAALIAMSPVLANAASDLHVATATAGQLRTITGLAAGGCNLIAFTTGRGSAIGFPSIPVIKIASNSVTYNRMRDNMDVNGGAIADGEMTVPQVGREIFDLMLRVASGQKTCAERLGHKEFVPWRIGPMM